MLSDLQKDLLDRIYFSKDGIQGSFSALKPLYTAAKQQDKSITYKIVREYLKSVTPYLLHKRVIRKIQRRSLLVLYPHAIWSCDLIFYTKDQSVTNKQKKFCLTVQDCFSHYSFAEALTSKSAAEVLQSFQKILRLAKAQPKFLFVDQGKSRACIFFCACSVRVDAKLQKSDLFFRNRISGCV